MTKKERASFTDNGPFVTPEQAQAEFERFAASIGEIWPGGEPFRVQALLRMAAVYGNVWLSEWEMSRVREIAQKLDSLDAQVLAGFIARAAGHEPARELPRPTRPVSSPSEPR